jgi:hypothetical protein
LQVVGDDKLELIRLRFMFLQAVQQADNHLAVPMADNGEGEKRSHWVKRSPFLR